ncbi:MAG: class I SAM-dependent methyltransferase [Acidimicrobiales bacterium]|nr:class I SAM-dependent methyltransferase [Acidimicrobiales bacterium]
MDDRPASPPAALALIEERARAHGFDAMCDAGVGALLRTLARSLIGGRALELGTGPGTSTAWILDGMAHEATLLTIDEDAAVVGLARSVLGGDDRVTFCVGDGSQLLRELAGGTPFGLVFADTWPGKYWDLDLALNLVAPGGFYVIDDMLPQPNWPDGHASKVAELLDLLDARTDLTLTRMNWSSGVVLAVRC